MTALDYLQIILFFICLIGLIPLLGNYMAKVYKDEKHGMLFMAGRPERWIYKISGVNPAEGMNWKTYTWSLLLFNLMGFLVVFLLQLFQSSLPLNPQKLPDTSWHLAFNTAISFVTNTNWQSYSGETTLSYFVQLVGLTVQNFVSAATGMAVLIALIRGITEKTTDNLGNFWVDSTRTVLYILLPLSVIVAILLVGQGVVQNFTPYIKAHTLQGNEQLIPMGPAASQIAIKQLGTNGGGFFNTNSAHPFENPTPFTNFIEMLAILLIPASLTFTYGKLTGSVRHGWTLFNAMMVLLVAGLVLSLISEYAYNPVIGHYLPMEGKETRLGVSNSVLWSVVTTAASSGSVNAMHDSLSPLSGMVAMINMMLGEVIFGGVGAGLYGMIVFVILTVFIAGLMVGRTPEYLGKKIETFEMKMIMVAVLAPSVVILLFSALACTTGSGLAGLNNAGPHGLSEILYAFSSAAGNNGSAFAGLNANTPFYNILIGIGMLIGRFGIIIPVLAIAGSLGRKKITPPSAGTFRTDNSLFLMLLIGVIIIVGGLTFFPAISLGPGIEQLLMHSGITF